VFLIAILTQYRRSVSINVTLLFLVDVCKPQKAAVALTFSFCSPFVFYNIQYRRFKHSEISSYFRVAVTTFSRPQWPLGLRHKLLSSTYTLGSQVRIPIEAWMSVCVYSSFVLSCVQVAALRRADPPSKESYSLYKSSRN
jgi:hypothetical protein